MKIKATLFFLILSLSSLFAQKTNEFASVDNIALQIPDSSTKSVESLSRYFQSKFNAPTDKVRAAFYWVAKNIKYDVKNMYSVNFYENENDIKNKALQTRKAVCMGYATLFVDILKNMGFSAFRVEGYTKQNGLTANLPHAWAAVKIDSGWFLFDPTWAAGYVSNSKFVSQYNNVYWKTKPEENIKSHMPFDPMWQLLSNPINSTEFNQAKTATIAKKGTFNYSDSIALYTQQNELERLCSFTARLEKNGVANSIVFDRFQYNKREIDYLKNKQFTDLYNAAVIELNEGVNALNDFINYRNKQFSPSKTDPELKLMLENIDTKFSKVKTSLEKIQNPNANEKISINQLYHSLQEGTNNLNEQKAFLTKYLSTNKLLRKTLFYKYSWMGIPLNK